MDAKVIFISKKTLDKEKILIKKNIFLMSINLCSIAKNIHFNRGKYLFSRTKFNTLKNKKRVE